MNGLKCLKKVCKSLWHNCKSIAKAQSHVRTKINTACSSSLSHYTLVQFHIKCEVLHQSCFERTIKGGKTVTKMRLSAFKSNKNNNKITFALKT